MGGESLDELGDVAKSQGSSLLRVAYRITQNAEDAADAVQDGLVMAVQNLEAFQHRSAMSTWLHRIVVNAALMQLRRPHRRYETHGFIPDQRSDTRAADEALASAAIAIRMREIILSLPGRHRDVLWARHVQDLSTADAALQLGVSEGVVKTRLFRAKRVLSTRAHQLKDGVA